MKSYGCNPDNSNSPSKSSAPLTRMLSVRQGGSSPRPPKKMSVLKRHNTMLSISVDTK